MPKPVPINDYMTATEEHEPILVQIKIDKELLKCQICLGYVDFPILQCSFGPHYICHQCGTKIRKCQICRSGRFVYNRLLGGELLQHAKACTVPGCGRLCLPWTKDHHELECRHRPQPCFLCGQLVSLSEIESHFSTGCSCVYMDSDTEETQPQTTTGFGCSRTERSTFEIPLQGERNICVRSGEFYIFCKLVEIGVTLRCWIVTAFHKISPSYVATGKDPSVEFEVMDKTGCLPTSLAIMMQPFINLQDISDTFCGILPVVSSDMHIHCTIRQDARNCKTWMSPISGIHHEHQAEGLFDNWEETNSSQ